MADADSLNNSRNRETQNVLSCGHTLPGFQSSSQQLQELHNISHGKRLRDEAGREADS